MVMRQIVLEAGMLESFAAWMRSNDQHAWPGQHTAINHRAQGTKPAKDRLGIGFTRFFVIVSISSS
jgi:hypothetical protein